jgi:hypothetical protein
VKIGAKSFLQTTMVLSMSSLVVDLVTGRVVDSGDKPSGHLSEGPGFSSESL